MMAGLVAAVVAPVLLPGTAQAYWWRGHWFAGPKVVMLAPPVAVAPPLVLARRPIWVPAHWVGPYWVGGHWV